MDQSAQVRESWSGTFPVCVRLDLRELDAAKPAPPPLYVRTADI